MVKLIAMYKKPQDAATFDQVYFGEHIPATAKMPGLRRAEINKVTGSPMGEPEYYLIASLYFDDLDALNAAMASEEGRTSARSLRKLGAEVAMLTADVQDM